MNKISLKLKVALINTLFMIFIVFLVLLYMIIISNQLIDNHIRVQLKDVITDNATKIYYENNLLNLKNVDFYKSEVYTYVYTDNGKLIQSYQSNLPYINNELSDKYLGTITINEDEYYFYDIYVDTINGDAIWIRGITLKDDETQVVTDVLFLSFITLPIFVILAGFGCYIISKKSFEPINKIIETAINIKDSEDLTHRINLNGNNDEIHNLANTFDLMFDTLEHAFEIEKEFTRDASHELRTPISVILSQSEYALNNKLKKEEYLNIFKIINNQGTKMMNLSSNLLTLSKLEKGIYKMNMNQINLSELLEIICEEKCSLDTSKLLKYNIEKNIFINADTDLIIRCISNIISNAYKYTDECGEINISLESKSDHVIIKVRDNGIGIKSENINKIFNSFFQEDDSRTSENMGIGLGLAMVNKIIKLHDGEIFVDSVKNSGTTFTINLKK